VYVVNIFHENSYEIPIYEIIQINLCDKMCITKYRHFKFTIVTKSKLKFTTEILLFISNGGNRIYSKIM